MAKAVVGQLKLCKEDVNEVTLRGAGTLLLYGRAHGS
jgi:hypothetical protein